MIEEKRKRVKEELFTISMGRLSCEAKNSGGQTAGPRSSGWGGGEAEGRGRRSGYLWSGYFRTPMDCIQVAARDGQWVMGRGRGLGGLTSLTETDLWMSRMP